MAIWHICLNYWGHLLWEGHLLVSWDFARIKQRAHDELFQANLEFVCPLPQKLTSCICAQHSTDLVKEHVLLYCLLIWVNLQLLLKIAIKTATIMHCISAVHVIFIWSSDPSLLILSRKKNVVNALSDGHYRGWHETSVAGRCLHYSKS